MLNSVYFFNSNHIYNEPDYDVTSATFQKNNTDIEITFSTCSYKEEVITCNTPSSEVSEGEYILKTITSMDPDQNFNKASGTISTDFQIKKEIIVAQTVKSYTITSTTPSFIIEINQETTILPEIFAENTEEGQISISSSCKKTFNEDRNEYFLLCSPIGLTVGETYTITYDECGIKSTEIEILFNILPTVDVLSLVISGAATTSTQGITALELEVPKTIASTKIDAVIEKVDDSSVSYTFACSYEAKDSKHYLQCSTPSSQVLVGSYKLKSMNGDKEDFAVAKVQSVVLQYKEEKYPIASPTGEERRQLLSRKIPIEFTLVSENEEMPKMYIVLKEEKYPLQGCVLNKTAVSCDSYRDSFPKGTYD